ncbi:HAD family hydrolase, partial [Mycobacterium sp. E3247]|uniref:HAD family hydrolase n=1 Tax=Mycobacterium sp. E3247 TaxID=1856864 RepID=UPI000A624C1D
TDKTGTLTEGRIRLVDAVDAGGAHSDPVRRLGLLATDVDPETAGASANSLDAALWESSGAQQLVGGSTRRVAMLPFDHARRATSALVEDHGKRLLVVKGAPEQIIRRCVSAPAEAQKTLTELFDAGRRVVAVAVKPAPHLATLTADDESELMLVGFCVFADEPKAAARQSLTQLADLGIEVKIATGDNARVAEKVCADLGLASKGTITGAEMEQFGDEEFEHAA